MGAGCDCPRTVIYIRWTRPGARLPGGAGDSLRILERSHHDDTAQSYSVGDPIGLCRAAPGSSRVLVLFSCGLFSMLGFGCALTTGYTEHRTTESNERRCAPSEEDTRLRSVSLKEVDQSQDQPILREVHDHTPTSFSWRVVNTAHAIEVLPLLKQLELTEELPARDESSRQITVLSLRQEVLGRVLLALIAVSSTAAHVSCEIERTFQVADRLKNSEQARTKQQTLLAVIIGAGAAVVSGGFSAAVTESIGEGVAAIVGGTIAGALGISALYQESEQNFRHPDNILREV